MFYDSVVTNPIHLFITYFLPAIFVSSDTLVYKF